MAREVLTRILCDVCMHVDEQYTEGQETPPITIGAAKPRLLALCDVHMKEVFEPIKELLFDLGMVVPEGAGKFPGTSPGSGVHPCPVPTCHKHARPFKHEQALRNHARNIHGTTVQALRAANGEQPDAPEPKQPQVIRAECDVPGCDTAYEWPEHSKPAVAMGVHKARRHGIPGAKSSARSRAK